MSVAKTTIEHNILSPKENINFVGHEKAVATLTQSFALNNMPNGWLISGPKGIGKATMAYRFAYHILSGEKEFRREISATDPVYARIKSNSHSDLLVLEAGYNEITGKINKEITVDDARKISSFLRLTSSETPYRIVIIDSADEMNINASNAILKLLEEPPEKTLLILISHSPGKLLPTIKSRCGQLKLNGLDESDALEIVNLNIPDIAESEAKKILNLADNSPGLATSIYHAGGINLYENIISILSSENSLNIPEIHEFADLLSKKDNIESWNMSMYLINWLICRIIISAETKIPFEIVSEKENYITQALLSKYPLENLIEIWEKVGRLIHDSESKSLDKKSVLVSIFKNLRV